MQRSCKSWKSEKDNRNTKISKSAKEATPINCHRKYGTSQTQLSRLVGWEI